MKLDFTPLFAGALLIGLLVVAAGLILRSTVPRLAVLGIVIAAAGAIPVLVGGYFLISERRGSSFHEPDVKLETEVLTEDREIQGMRLPKGAEVAWLGQPRRVYTVTLADPLRVLGLPLEGTVRFCAGAALETATLAEDHPIGGVPCAAHTEVEFNEAGRLKRCTASAPFEFKGHRYAGHYEVTLNAAGDIAQGLLAEDQEIDGHLCKQGTLIGRPRDRVTRFTPAREETIGGIACKAGSEVLLEAQHFYLSSAVLARDQEIGGIPAKGGEAVGFAYDHGEYKLDRCVTGSPATLREVNWPAGSHLEGLASGAGLAITMPSGSAGVTVGEIKIVGRCRVHLAKSLSGVEALEPAAYIGFRSGRFADFNIVKDQGYGHLRDAGQVEGVAYKAGDLVRSKL
jgi:hypothetical protein